MEHGASDIQFGNHNKCMTSRVIARLDIKNNTLIKGVHLEGLRVVGDPLTKAREYYEQGADELLVIDCVASLYQRNNLSDIIRNICKDIFIPVTVGGGISSITAAKKLFDSGADKVAVNTAALKDPSLIRKLSSSFGNQAVVLSIQSKEFLESSLTWRAMSEYGREKSNKYVAEWVQCAQELGIGEILITSIDKEGTGQGFDIQLLKMIRAIAKVPVLVSGGYGRYEHAIDAIQYGADGIVLAKSLHYTETRIDTLKEFLFSNGFRVRI